MRDGVEDCVSFAFCVRFYALILDSNLIAVKEDTNPSYYSDAPHAICNNVHARHCH